MSKEFFHRTTKWVKVKGVKIKSETIRKSVR
jgi:hypothetical protein